MRLDRWWYILPLRLRSLVRPADVERDLDDELQYHIERQIELNVAAGMTAEEARHEALRAMDGIEQHKEVIRDHRKVQVADTLIRDVRYALRLLGRSPIFTAVAILSLALGIGANAAIFQLIDTIRLRSLPVANPGELAEVRPDGPQAFGTYEGVNSKATYPLWEQIRSHQRSFSGVFAWGDTRFLIGGGAQAREARGLWVSGEFFRILGVPPGRGRLFGPGDDRRGCDATAAVVSHAFWQSDLGGRDSAIGGALTIQNRPFTIVGVTPPGFTGLEVGQTFEVALPVCAASVLDLNLDQRNRDPLDRRDHWWLTVMGRLKPEWTIARASEHLRSLSQGLLDTTVPAEYGQELVDGYRGIRFSAVAAGRGVSRLRDAHATTLSLLLGLTGLVLLITCGNLATLLLARASARGREMAVRVAIGASRRRLVSQMLIESLLVAIGGAALAVPVALLSSRALVAFLSVDLPLAVDWRLIAFVSATTTLTAILFGLLPALRASIVDPLAAMRQASRGLTVDRHRARFQRGLVVAQIAVSLVLVVSALFFVRTFRNLAAVDTGFEQNGTIAVLLRDVSSRDLAAEQVTAFQERLAAEIRAVPGVAAAASSTHVPLSGSIWSHFFRVTGRPADERKASRFAYVGPEYFSTLRIPMRSGRAFNAFDTMRSRRVLVVNDSFVRNHLQGVSPIGATLRTLPEPEFPETTYEIVGVVGDTKYAELRDEDCWCDIPGGSTAPIAFVPIAQNPSPFRWAAVMVRADGAVPGVTAAIAQRVERLDPAIAIRFIELKAQIRQRLAAEQLMAWLAGAFGLLAIVLVTVGLYGIIAYLAASRRNEIGIRLSLGSTRGQIVALMLRDNGWLLAAGLAIGLPLALAVTRGAGSLLFGLTPTDGSTIAGATLLLALAGTLAGSIPAWRASRIGPDAALRSE